MFKPAKKTLVRTWRSSLPQRFSGNTIGLKTTETNYQEETI